MDLVLIHILDAALRTAPKLSGRQVWALLHMVPLNYGLVKATCITGEKCFVSDLIEETSRFN